MASIGAPLPAWATERPDSLVTLESTGEAIDARGRVLEWALSQVGDRDPNEYFRRAAPQYLGGHHEHDTSWCGIFALAALREAGVCDWTWVTSLGFVNFEDDTGKRWLPKSSLPAAPGDIVVFGAPTWHHAIVHSFGDGKVRTIDGNTLPFPREGVACRERPIGAFGYYSLARLLREAP